MTPLELHNMMENFYLCSHLPLYAALENGKVLLSVGTPSTKLSDLPFSAEVYQHLQQDLLDEPLVHHHLKDGSTFTLCKINPNDPQKGIFIIGPYTTDASLKEVFPFKPAHCIVHLIDLLYAVGRITEEESSDGDYNYHVSKAKEYIEQHYAEPITLEALADYLGIHKSYFCTIFKQATKQSFCTYTNSVRVEQSKRLLKEGNTSILDIALATGFSSASYFNTTFKKLVGMTPIEYRNQVHL